MSIFRPIPGFDLYECDASGVVRRGVATPRHPVVGRVIRPHKGSVRLTQDGRSHTLRVERVVEMAFGIAIDERLSSLRGEIWRDVNGYEGYYQVSNMGRVRSVGFRSASTHGRIMRAQVNNTGYYLVTLRVAGIGRTLSVHRLVNIAFNGPPPPGHETNHINSKRLDNRAENLEWVPRSVNIRHSFTHGSARPRRGAESTSAKLTEDQVREIRALRGMFSQKVIASRYGVGQMTVCRIQRGERWAHVK